MIDPRCSRRALSALSVADKERCSVSVAPYNHSAGMIRSNSAPARSGAKSPRPSYLLNRGAHVRSAQEEPERDRKKPVPPHLHPTICGIRGRMYSPVDYITPILDSMSRLHDRTHGSGMRNMVRRDERQRTKNMMASAGAAGSSEFANTQDSYGLDAEVDQYPSFVAPIRPKPSKPGCLCENCGSNNPDDIRVDGSGHRVCESCGAQGSMYSYGTNHKETNDTDRSTARADVYKNKDPEVPRIKEPVSSTVVPDAAKRKMHIGRAQEIVNSSATKEVGSLSKKHERRLKSLIEAINNLFEELGQVDPIIKRKIRMDATAVFCASVKHCDAVCKKKECQKDLSAKPTRVIAREGIVFTMEQLSAGDGIEGVSRQTIVALQGRVNSSPAFSHRDNATQHQSCHAMISAISTDDNSIECPSVNSAGSLQTPERKGGGRQINPMGNAVPMKRQDSDVQSSPIVQMRDAISRLSVECGISSDVRDSAMCALQDANFVRQITENPIVSTKKTNRACAFVILRSVAEECGKPSAITTEDYCLRAGLSGVDVAPMIARVRAILPKSSLGGRVNDDDDFY